MIEEGTEAPDFTLPDQDGEDVTLSGLRGRPVVLYFYPKADTPGCTTQACGIRDHSKDYDEAARRVGVRVAAVGLRAQAGGALLDREVAERLAPPQLVPLALAQRRRAARPEHGLEVVPARLVGGNDPHFKRRESRRSLSTRPSVWQCGQ